MKCQICKSINVNLLLDYGLYPFFTVPVKIDNKDEILKKYNKSQLFGELKYNVCDDCGHVSIKKIPRQNIIDDLYSNYYSYPSPLKGEFEPIRDNYFVETFNKKINSICKKNKLNSVLEVGCYDGYILYKLKQDGYKVRGCDPSIGAEIGNSFGIEIDNHFFEPEKYLDIQKTFDIIISRHFIEHTADPFSFVKNLKSVLNSDGLLIIETPNIEHFIEKGLLEVFSLQHITLFTSESLKYLLKKLEMKVIYTNKESENLIMVAEQSSNIKESYIKSFSEINKQFSVRIQNNRRKIKKHINNYISNNKKIALWGAGGFGCAALSLFEIKTEYIDYYIDSDPEKLKMEYLTNSIQIISPESALKISPDLIIVASMYGEGILNIIKKLRFNCTVLKLSPEVKMETIKFED